ncbi:hypothetical protein BKA65DRAFT_497191 [Rhexocercosporidium sp. MPI-PUGE-AT-0058]|nr:hypothetical protein BKA65DRAFT_497191 [Rhexocercosporidium sp. MPI-PUGE-AT-0058]
MLEESRKVKSGEVSARFVESTSPLSATVFVSLPRRCGDGQLLGPSREVLENSWTTKRIVSKPAFRLLLKASLRLRERCPMPFSSEVPIWVSKVVWELDVRVKISQETKDKRLFKSPVCFYQLIVATQWPMVFLFLFNWFPSCCLSWRGFCSISR